MKRDFLEALGLEKDVIDKILDENSRDIGREKQKLDAVNEDLAGVKEQLAQRDSDLAELKKASKGQEDLQAKLDELQAKYDEETEAYRTKIAERDMDDAVNAAISAASLSLNSAAAKRMFKADLKAKGLELKDGKLVGFDEFKDAWLKDNQDSVAPEKPPASIVHPSRAGGVPEVEPKNIQIAREMGKARAERAKASNEVLKNYM